MRKGGEEILRWTQPEAGEESGDLYRRFMGKEQKAVEEEEISGGTFIWMQGERDADAALKLMQSAS
ncbi:hypothetical protein P0Y35_06510 [Kiritimatiellaeota bacterium B1221]|nr:hypothetical protein [Kiritimatiellaeota bacterium B1221]